MATHFNRSSVQTFFEKRVGCHNSTEFSSFLPQLAALSLNLSDESSLCDKIQEDIQGQFERSLLTLLQALLDISSKNYLWAITKLYYSIFYAIRCELHLNGLSIIRCRQVFTTDGRRGSKVKRFNNNDKGDHGIAIALITKHLAPYDIMQGASIDGINVYMWMKALREVVQYKMRRPPELTSFQPFFPDEHLSLQDQVLMFLNDTDPYFCFDPDYAALAIPIKRLQLTANNVKSSGVALDTDFVRSARLLMDRSPAGKLLKPILW